MAKQKISNYVFSPGISSTSNLYPNAYSLISQNKEFIKKEATAYIAASRTTDNATNLYPFAVALLTINKTFLQDELTAWIQYQVNNNLSPFSGFTFNAALCKRDTGYVIDAYIYDLRYGGNEKTREVSSQYWLNGVPQVDGSRTQEVAAHIQLAAIINSYILPKISYASQQSPVTSTQNTTGTAGETGTSTIITTLSNIVTSVITNGLSVLPAVTYSIRNFAGYTYDSDKCERDIGYVIDAYLNDLRYGGNVKTKFVSSRYWEGTVPQVDGDRKPEIVTHQFIRDLINNYLLPQAAYTPIQLSEPRIIDGTHIAEAGAPTRITTLSTILINVITNGLSSLPTTAAGVSTIKLQGKYDLSDLLLITNTSSNTVLYNFSDPSLGATSDINTAYNSNGLYRDDDFTSFLATADYVTTLTLTKDTSGQSSTDEIQIFVEQKEMRVRPYDFGTDAIERMRIAAPQAMLDADFEYGLQPTKWQAIGLARGYPSVYEVPGTDTQVTSVTTDASTGNTPSGTGESLITVTTPSPHGFTVGTPITIKALANTITGFSRAEGTFIVYSVPSTTTFTYYAVSKVGTSAGQVLATTYTQLRKGAFFTGASIGSPGFSVYTNGSNTTVTSKWITSSGTDQMAFTGLPPGLGGPLTASGMGSGAQVTGVVGSGGLAVTSNIETTSEINDTALVLTDPTGVLEGMAIDNGSGTAIFVNGVAGGTVNFTGPLTTARLGNTETYTNISGTNISSTGVGAIFSVTRTSGAYASITVTTVGSGYAINDKIKILGTDLQGASPLNDITVTVTGLSGGSGVGTNTFIGTSVSGDAVYSNANHIQGGGAAFDVTITSGVYAVTLATGGAGGGYTAGDKLVIPGVPLGGTAPANNITITVSTVNGVGAISTFTFTGTGTGTSTLTNVIAINQSSGATFNVDRTGGVYTVTLATGGIGYTASQVLKISGGLLGGTTPTNDLSITVSTVGTVGEILTFTRSGTAVSSNRTFTSVNSITITAAGVGASFDITRSSSNYVSAVTNLVGSGYVPGDKIKVLGTQLGGATPANDATITITGEALGIWTTTVSGTAVAGATVQFWSAFSFSELTTASIPDGTSVTSSAIAQIEVTFSSAHGLVPGASILTTINSNGTLHELAAGPFFVEQVPTLTTLRYTVRAAGTVDANTGMSGIIYARPDSFFIHRPYDGGVQLGTGGPQHGAQAIRQSKKYIRYQSGKGIMYTTGALFAPSYNLLSLTATDTAVGSYITVVTDDVDHGCQVGGVIRIIGVDTAGYNGVYTVADVVNERTLRIQATTVLGNVYATVSTNAQMSIKNWHGATVRAGTFDEQNGMYWQYDGQYLSVGRRTSTFQLTGVSSIVRDTNTITGTNTRFRDQLKAGDKIVIKGMTHVVTNVTSQTSMTVTPDYRGAISAVNSKICLITDIVYRQSQFNLDKIDGTGPSGYNVDTSKMQMIGMQWSWYGAGFIDYMLRGSDGNFVFVHRIRNSNTNTEAYMRTGNMPVRYEVINESATGKLISSITASQTTVPLVDAGNFPNESGIVYIENELIAFSGKSGNTLTGCTRSAPMTNFVGGAQRTFRAGVAATHEYSTGVVLVSNTISPIISHWGSAMLTDGRFDEDRGYIFSYAATNISVTTTKQTAFLIRLAPSVSNAIVGDLGERELLNRAQLLLKGVEITSDTGVGGLVVEGVLNPQNYPLSPGDILWGGLQSSAQGGQPSFAQIAPGGSVSWSSGATRTTQTATVASFLTGTITLRAAYGWSVYSGYQNVFITAADYTTYTSQGLQTGQGISATGIPGGTTIVNIANWGTVNGTAYYYIQLSQNGNQIVTPQQSATVTNSYKTSATSTLYFTSASWSASGATRGTEVTDTKFPAGTFVSGVTPASYFGNNYFRVTFSQTSTAVAVTPGTTTVTFTFGQPPYGLPGETVFSFIAAPGSTQSLDLGELKELTTTSLGGRGTYPNGPDVLAINVYKASGDAINTNIILRWGEAQA